MTNGMVSHAQCARGVDQLSPLPSAIFFLTLAAAESAIGLVIWFCGCVAAVLGKGEKDQRTGKGVRGGKSRLTLFVLLILFLQIQVLGKGYAHAATPLPPPAWVCWWNWGVPGGFSSSAPDPHSCVELILEQANIVAATQGSMIVNRFSAGTGGINSFV